MADIDYIKENRLEDTGFAYTLRLIGGKYKMQLLYALNLNHGPLRYNALKRLLVPISFKALTNTLRELETDGLIHREEYPQIPPKVEYSLTPLGESLIPVMEELCNWGETQQKILTVQAGTEDIHFLPGTRTIDPTTRKQYQTALAQTDNRQRLITLPD